MKPRSPPTFSNQLRQAIAASGMTRYQIAKQSGISQSVLSLFSSGRRGLSLKSIDALVEVLNLELKSQKSSTKKKES